MNSPLFDFFNTDEELSRQLYGSGKNIKIDYMKLYDFDTEYAMRLIQKPVEEIKYLTNYAKATTEIDKEIHIVNLPETAYIHELKSRQMNTLIQTEGTVIQRSKPLMRATNLCFQCKNCGRFTYVPQTRQYREYPRDACSSCDSRKWSHVYEQSEFTEYQEIIIQELMENTPNNGNPEKIKVELNGSLIRSCESGETIKLVGILTAQDTSSKSMEIRVETILTAVSLMNNTEAETITLTEEDISEIKVLMSSEEHVNNVINSIAPQIYGMGKIKEALAYQLCEGQVKYINGTRIRGQVHILLAGPPGCGKSELGDFMTHCHPKGRKAIGKGSSGVGLTASVVKDGENFVLRGGAMVLADNGFLFIDELDKMSSNDSGAMHPGMEQQKIKIDKADISAELNTRCSILAACNPIGGRWSDHQYPLNNLMDEKKGIPRPLIDRFALIFIIHPNTDDKLERQVIEHIMKANSNPESIQPPYNIQLLRKIFAYARTIEVSVPEDITKDLTEFCLTLYQADKLGEMSVITRRQPMDLIRIAEASARLHGRGIVTMEDAENAKQMVAYSMKSYGVNPVTGKIDQTEALYGPAKTKREMIQDAVNLLRIILKTNIDSTKVDRREYIQRATRAWGCKPSEAGEVVDILLKDNTFFCPTPYTLGLSDNQPQGLYSYSDTEENEDENDTDIR